MTKLLFGLILGVSAFFLIRKSRTFFIRDGEIGQIEELDLSSLPQKINVNLLPLKPSPLNTGITGGTTSSPDPNNPLFNPENFA